METAKQPHIYLGKEHIRPVVIVVGDPARAEMAAKLCDKQTQIAYNREYRTFLCEKNGVEFLICSHGVGSAGAAICFEELIKIGAKCIMRAGTAGSLQSHIKSGDVVVVHSAVIEEGVSPLYVPPGMPAVATPEMYNCMVKVAKDHGVTAKGAMSLSSDLYYSSPILGSTLEKYAKAKVDVVEMEVSALFTICRQHRVSSCAILAIDGSPLVWQETGTGLLTQDELKAAKLLMLNVAIDTAVEATKTKCYEV
eukprot:GHVP01050727.1.p1 GENE.GHVP01050727.1~~GHVP01050727.1.p1  ORF type:complete len:252 (+),score=29.77 GHVP01050727.1:412-1167(+)